MKSSDLTEFIKNSWKKTIRIERTDSGSTIGVPYRYFVPCASGGFGNLFYWDSYFTARGMIVHGESELVKSTVDDMLYLVRKLGYMPNGNATHLLGRSQPPLLSEMVKDIYSVYKDPVWLEGAYSALQTEYEFWMTKRILPCGLNRYGYEGSLDVGLEIAHRRLAGLDFGAMSDKEIAENVMADAESGWDFSPRCELHQTDFAYVDLNSILYMFEKNMAFFASELKKNDSESWENRAAERRRKMCDLMFDGAVFRDYDSRNDKLSPIFSAASFYPLWAGLATEEQAKSTVENLFWIECEYGISPCEKGIRKVNYQWDYPNGWAPIQYAVAYALFNCGYAADAERVAKKYVCAAEEQYRKTGTLWEKYNVSDGTINVVDEYKMPEMLGWTAGVYVDLKEKLLPRIKECKNETY